MTAEYVVHLSESHAMTDGDETTVTVVDYDDFGSMYNLTFADGSTRSVGKQLVEEIAPVE